VRRGDLLAVPGGRVAHRAGFGVIFLLDGPGLPLLRDLLFFSLLVPIAFIDIDHRIIPDETLSRRARSGSLLSFLPGGDWMGVSRVRCWGRAPLCQPRSLYEEIRGPKGMGGGDIKLLAMIGAFVGWRGTLATIFFGALLGAIGGMLAMRKGGMG